MKNYDTKYNEKYNEMVEELKEKMIFFRKNYLHMTQKEVAEACGIGPSAVGNFESYRYKFNLRLFLWYVTKGFDVNKVIEGDYWPVTRAKRMNKTGRDKA